MYEKYRCEVLTQIGSLDSETLKMVVDAMDTVAAYYKIERAENALSVVGRDEFLEIAATYVIVRKTEGIKDGTLEHITRIMRQFIFAIHKPITEIVANDIRAFLYNYQRKKRNF